MIKFDHPVNSESNMKVWNHQPSVYSYADCDPPMTQIMAVVGSETIWPNSQQRAWTEITSGTSFTIAAVPANSRTLNWMRPADPDVDTVVNDFDDSRELIAVFVDGHVETARNASKERLRELLFI